jgi:hypothetical protein
MKLLYVPLILSLTFLSSCSSDKLQERLVVNTVEADRPALPLVQPVPLQLEPTKYFVLTPDTAQAVFQALKDQGIEPVIVGTTVAGFSIIVTNNVKVQQLIQQYQTDVAQQHKYYTSPTN